MTDGSFEELPVFGIKGKEPEDYNLCVTTSCRVPELTTAAGTDILLLPTLEGKAEKLK